MALVTPLLFGIVGAIITFAMGVYARAQMIEITHHAVRVCAAAVPTSIAGVKACVAQQLANQLAMSRMACTPVPQVTQPQPLALPIPGPWAIWTVTAQVTCSTGKWGVPLARLLPGGGPQAITITARSTASFIPGAY